VLSDGLGEIAQLDSRLCLMSAYKCKVVFVIEKLINIFNGTTKRAES